MTRYNDAPTEAPIDVGVLFSQSGITSVIETTQYQGTMVAIDEINQAGGINGRELRPIFYDPCSDNSLYREYARKLIADDGVNTIFGCYTSSSRRAVLPIVERLNGLLWYPTLYEGYEYSPNVIYTGASPNQNSLVLCEYMARQPGSRVYFVGSDYIYPQQSNRIMRASLTQRGCEVVGERYVPLNAKRQDFLTIFNDIRQKQPDFIFSTVVGDATTLFYQMYADFGFDPKKMPIASLSTTEAEISSIGDDVSENHITCATYFESVDTPRNHEFVSRCKKLFGDDVRTNMCMEAAYYQVHLFKSAAEMVNTDDTDLIRPMVLGLETEAPQGQVGIHQKFGHGNLWSRFGKVGRAGQFNIVFETATSVEADPFFLRLPI